MRKHFLLLAFSLLLLFSVYASPSYAPPNILAPGTCEDALSHCDADGLGYDLSGCKNSCISGNTCWNGFEDACTLTVGPQGWICDYAYQDNNPPNCGECGVQTCSGLAGWWCAQDNSKCSGGRICVNNVCVSRACVVCPDGTLCKDPPICSKSTPGQRCNNNNGVGVLQDDPTCNACVKYDVKTAEKTGGGGWKSIPEICLYNYDGEKYTGYKLDEYLGPGKLKETACDQTTNTCIQVEQECGSTDSLSGVDVSKSKLVEKMKNIPAIPAGTKTFYCFHGAGDIPPSCNSDGIQNNGETGTDCGGGGCPACGAPDPNDCDPGNPPYERDGTPNCQKCGCPPSQYEAGMFKSQCAATAGIESGAEVACNNVPGPSYGTCSYTNPPGAIGEVPDCPRTTPESEYNITYVRNTVNLLTGSDSSFAGYRLSGTWQNDNTIKAGLPNTANGAPAVFFENARIHLILGKSDGTFSGYDWNGTGWQLDNAVSAGLTDIGSDSKPSIFYLDGRWHMLAGNDTGQFRGFSWNGTGWTSNASLAANLPDVGDNAAPSVIYKEGIMYLISGEKGGGFSGYFWNGTDWQSDASITSGLGSAGTYSAPYAFYNNTKLYLIAGKGDGTFAGYNWTGTAWQPDSGITAGLADAGSRASPAIFRIDTTYQKTFRYATGFFINGMYEYPNAGSQCWQNKTNITVPEGHACQVNIYANTTHSWGVRLKATAVPGKALVQDPNSVCGYVSDDLFDMCWPVGFGHTDCCPANFTPTLQAGTYEFGIVSSTGVSGGKVSKGCAYIEKCSDCTNPYAQYYCDLCIKDTCKDEMQNCNEGGIDCGGSCVTGHETDNSYVPVFDIIIPPGLINPIIFGNNMGLNCVDGIDNDHDCLIDCTDTDCAGSTACSASELGDVTPPETTIVLTPPVPNGKNGIYVSDVTVGFQCIDAETECEYTKYRLNGGEWQIYLVPFILSQEDRTTIDYYSRDRSGNTESMKSKTIILYKTPPSLALVGPADIQLAVGETGRLTAAVKNLLNIPDRIIITVKGKPEKLHNWVWLEGHRYDSGRYSMTLDLGPGEEKAFAVDVFGGEASSGFAIQPSVTITAESDTTGLKAEVSSNVYIVYEEGGMFVQTPELGWLGVAVIAIVGAVLALII